MGASDLHRHPVDGKQAQVLDLWPEMGRCQYIQQWLGSGDKVTGVSPDPSQA